MLVFTLDPSLSAEPVPALGGGPHAAALSHPPGLYVLFATELGERYSFYALMAILTLYMDEHLRFPSTRLHIARMVRRYSCS